LGSFDTLGILNEAMVDILAMWGCTEAIAMFLVIVENGRRLLDAIGNMESN
jgi:hypothetical protein